MHQEILLNALQVDNFELQEKTSMEPVVTNVHLSSSTARILANTIVIIKELDETSTKNLLNQFALETKEKITYTGVKRKRLCQDCLTPLAPEELPEHVMMGAWAYSLSGNKTRGYAQITQKPNDCGQE